MTRAKECRSTAERERSRARTEKNNSPFAKHHGRVARDARAHDFFSAPRRNCFPPLRERATRRPGAFLPRSGSGVRVESQQTGASALFSCLSFAPRRSERCRADGEKNGSTRRRSRLDIIIRRLPRRACCSFLSLATFVRCN